LLGGETEIKEDEGGDEKWEASSEKIMFQLTDAGGKLEFVSVGRGKSVTSAKLDTNDVFVIDVGAEIYVWIGKGASKAEKNMSMSSAQKYLEEYKRPAWLPLTKIIEGSENELFTSLMTPKSGRKFKKSTGGPTVEQKGEMGCYLTEEDSSNGSLFLNWSQGAVTGALAYFKPTKSVPKFKFKAKGGKTELTRETNSNRKNFFEGWCNFFKLAKEYKSTIKYMASSVTLLTHVGSKIAILPRGEMLEIKTIEAVAAIPGSSAAFEGIQTTDRGSFLNKSQDIGAALVLPAWK